MRRVTLNNAFLRNERGAIPVEFALIGPVFFALTLSIVEFGVLYARFNVIESSIEETARIMRTGRTFMTASPACTNEAACFEEHFCDGVDELVKCEPGLNFNYDVVAYATFQELAADTAPLLCPSDSGGSQVGTPPPYNAGVSSSIMRIRVCYELPAINPYLGFSFPKAGSGNLKFLKTTIFANEPYDG